MESPYTPPTTSESETATIARSTKIFGWAAVVFGFGVVIPPLFGLAGTLIGMIGAFNEIAKTGSGDPSELAADISVALLTMFWGLIFSALSLIPFVVFLLLFLKRRKMLRGLKR